MEYKARIIEGNGNSKMAMRGRLKKAAKKCNCMYLGTSDRIGIYEFHKHHVAFGPDLQTIRAMTPRQLVQKMLKFKNQKSVLTDEIFTGE